MDRIHYTQKMPHSIYLHESKWHCNNWKYLIASKWIYCFKAIFAFNIISCQLMQQGPFTQFGDICPSQTYTFGLKWVNADKVGVFLGNLTVHKICSLNPFCPCTCSEPRRFNIQGMARVNNTLAVRGLTVILFKFWFNIALMTFFAPFLSNVLFPPN